MLQSDLIAEVCKDLVIYDLEDIEANKLRVAKYYNKRVLSKQFFEGDLV